MECIGHGAGSRNFEGDFVSPRRGNVDRVPEPLSRQPVQPMSLPVAGSRRSFQVDAVGTVAVVRSIG